MIVIRPTRTGVLVKLKLENETASGIKIVRQKEEWREETLMCEVVAVGPEVDELIKPGKFVLMAGHCGKWIDPEITNEPEVTHRIVEQDELFCVLDEKEEVTV